jgi:hypothetical protein
MPDKKAITRARADARKGKSASTQAGEFVREEMEELRKGKGAPRSAKQAIAIGLSKARRAGVDLPATPGASARTRAQAQRDIEKAKTREAKKTSPSRSRSSSARKKARAGRGGP